MACFGASQEKTGKIGTCKLCGGSVFSDATPIYDSGGGDYEPEIDDYIYRAICEKCGTTSSPAKKIKDIHCAFLKV